MAIYIRVQALQNKPTESDKKKRPQTDNFVEAISHFKLLDDSVQPPGKHLVELLHSKFHLTPEEEVVLSKNYQSLVVKIGQWAAGDEKLFHWTGESSWLRMCPNKDDYIGLWFYMLAIRLLNGLSILIYTKSHTVETSLGGTIHCATVVSEWADVVKAKTVDNKTLLVADSYYLDRLGWQILQNKKIPYICAIQQCRFQELADKAKTKSKHEGDTAMMYNEKTKDMLVTHWYAEAKIGRKFVMSNAYTKTAGNTRKGFVPGCDDFSLMFNTCDHFNREMHDKTWPHRCSTAPHQLHNYHMTCMLLNTYNIWLDKKKIAVNDLSFKEFGVQLANELYLYSLSI